MWKLCQFRNREQNKKGHQREETIQKLAQILWCYLTITREFLKAKKNDFLSLIVLITKIQFSQLSIFNFSLTLKQPTTSHIQLRTQLIHQHMPSNHRQKAPIFHRLKSEQQGQVISSSPNIYTGQFQRQNILKRSIQRRSLGRRDKYKNTLQSRTSPSNCEESQRLNLLVKQNQELRKEVLKLKVHQFYQLDDKKLKQLLVKVESLKKQLRTCKEELQKCQIQKDFFRRANIQLRSLLQRMQEAKVSQKKQIQKNRKTIVLFTRNICQDQQITQILSQKPVTSSSKQFDEFQDCRMLLESKSTTKKDRLKRTKQSEGQHVLNLQGKQRVVEKASPRDSAKSRLLTPPKQTNDMLIYRQKRNQQIRKEVT